MTNLNALDDPIIIGNTYGYSVPHSKGTNNHTIIGIAIKNTDNRTTLKVLVKRSFISDEICSTSIENQKISVRSLALFPVDIESQR